MITQPPTPQTLIKISEGMAQTGERGVQATVAEVLMALPETDNTRVHADVADIAVALPPDLANARAADMARQTERWMR